ncbi:MAG: hypothetical protein JWN14_3376 [Chthonomonadales bacterium]|nr:hypothetical protein [Chthonomonadales bacterium]
MTIRTLWRWCFCFLVINGLLVGWGVTHRRQPTLRVVFLDVGQGDAAAIESPSGKVLLIDTGGVFADGSDNEGRRVVGPYLRSRGIRRIDMELLTHPHADHIGGAATLLERFPTAGLLDNGQQTDSPVLAHLRTDAAEHHIPYLAARRGQILDFQDGVTARILAPTEAETYGSPNNASIVLLLQYGRTTFLFTGDAEADEEADLLATHQPLICDVLKVGHHGSHTSTTPPFLVAAHPHIAIISVGAHNLYGHPSPEVLDRLRTSGAKIYRTDKNGAVTCTSDGITVHTESMNP